MDRIQSRRPYVSAACTNCKRKHAKCSGVVPCKTCKVKNLKCHYAPGRKRGPKEKSINRLDGAQITDQCNDLGVTEYFKDPLDNEQCNDKSDLGVTEYFKNPLNNDFVLYNDSTLIHPYNHDAPTTTIYNTCDSFNFDERQTSLEFQQQNGFQKVIYGVFIMPLTFSQNISFNGDCNLESHENNGDCNLESHENNGVCNFEFHENNLITEIYPPNYNSTYPFDHFNSSNLFNNQSMTNMQLAMSNSFFIP
ncbi:15822_t:CDS:1 [Racocetra persica]|uniref:15822_t:CDS:1 n=1 Tax=Racocetra persica TaxID=160502 RepID=A0ACA9P6Q0_9GLOM|nr:15822_t:CDS:1 [Racocetra persica]